MVDLVRSSPAHTSRPMGRRKRALALALLSVLFALARTAAGADRPVTPADVENALKRGAVAELRVLEGYRFESNISHTVLAAMALLNAGVPRDHPALAQALERIAAQAERNLDNYEGVYRAGLVNVLLLMLKEPQYRRLAERMAQRLQSLQSREGGWGDNSRTQFALLGLRSAQELGVEIPAEVYKRARRNLEAGQNADGSWGYSGANGSGYGSMTAAGISSLYIVNEQLYKETKVCGAVPSDERLKKALRWLGANFSVTTNPGSGGNHYYYLYALERIGVLTGQRFIGGHDWYREGAEFLVRAQTARGSWSQYPFDTEFALLFLGKGRDPVVMQKLASGNEWNTDPYDMKDLVEQAAKDLSTRMSSQVVDTTASAAALAAAPILYLQGHGPFEWDATFRAAVKAFVDNGGFIFASACCADKRFDRSFRAEMAAIFPDTIFERLPPEHAIYSIRHPIAAPGAKMILGLNTGCRTAVLYAPQDLCCAWGGCRGCLDKACVAGAEAKNLGVNMIAYALNFQRLRDKLDAAAIARRPEEKLGRNSLLIGQLVHSGDWNPDPASIPNLAQTLKQKTDMKGEISKRPATPGTDDLGDFPMLYLTGHRAFQYLPTQAEALRAYLDKGGFLFADPCCGKSEFDAAFRKLCEQLYPDRPLAQIKPDHAIMREPNAIEKVQYKPTVKALFPQLGDALQLEGISAPDGRLLICYSRFNVGCELQGHGCATCLGITDKDAYKIAVNALLYALSH